MHQSVATIDSPQFLNLQPLDINPLMSKCEIKILYLGPNRNHSYIDEETAIKIGKKLRGAPIVGHYRETKEDFTDHGEQITINDEGIKFETTTVPYGFVSPDAKVWFQNFEDTNALGETITRKYLMTTGFLWTTEMAPSQLAAKDGRPHSMKLHDDSVEGFWETSVKNGIDYFIISDAVIQNLCILGDDVEPCFEGSSVTPPIVSANFTLNIDENFMNTLKSMQEDLKYVLQKGGQQTMDDLDLKPVEMESEKESVITETSFMAAADSDKTEFAKDDKKEESSKEDKAETDKDSSSGSDSSDGESKESKQDSKEEQKDSEEEDDKEKKTAEKYALLESELNALKKSYAELQLQCQELSSFKAAIENDRKDQLIAEFFMLSDADKADVIANKETYTLDEIKAKLSVICFDKKISFSSAEEDPTPAVHESTTTFNLNTNESDAHLPEWVKRVKEEEKFN